VKLHEATSTCKVGAVGKPLINLLVTYAAGVSVLCPLPHPLAVVSRVVQLEEEVTVVNPAVSAHIRVGLVLLMLRL
jgi:hypothetical protein